MNCCWILLLLLFSGRGGCGSAGPCNSNNNGCCGQRETRDADRRREQENGCGCEEVRSGSRNEEARQRQRMEDRDDCDIASTIPQPWQEYAKRDSEDCRD